MIEKSEGSPVLSQQSMPDRVERSAVHPRARRPHQPLRARQHLVRGAAREREQQDAFGSDAAIDEMRHAIDERPRLARSGARYDEQRTVTVCRRRELFGVQLRAEVARRRRDLALASGINAELICHDSRISRRASAR